MRQTLCMDIFQLNTNKPISIIPLHHLTIVYRYLNMYNTFNFLKTNLTFEDPAAPAAQKATVLCAEIIRH